MILGKDIPWIHKNNHWYSIIKDLEFIKHENYELYTLSEESKEYPDLRIYSPKENNQRITFQPTTQWNYRILFSYYIDIDNEIAYSDKSMAINLDSQSSYNDFFSLRVLNGSILIRKTYRNSSRNFVTREPR